MNTLFKLALISFSIIHIFGCSNNPKNNNSSTNQVINKSAFDSTKKVTNGEKASVTPNTKNTTNIAELIQGKWQHLADKTNYLIFEGSTRKEIAEGMEKWDEEPFILSDKCQNQSDKDNGEPVEKDSYISCPQSDLCWYIINVDHENLTLSYTARGNTLMYKRVK